MFIFELFNMLAYLNSNQDIDLTPVKEAEQMFWLMLCFQKNRRNQRRLYKEKNKKIKKSKRYIKHKGVKNQRELKTCLKMPVFHKLFYYFFNSTNKINL